ncbi:hypothetical protein [Neobacillus sp. D3-1R]|uniref:hypothetical protein n=1 Tax=Neobacillus sp. D3-1R TaxID=3445778 RepID=UPI003FA0055B
MNKWLDAAVLNNISWCGIICETHGISDFTRENVWGLMSEAPPYYPDLITSSNLATSNEVIDVMGDRNIKSLKDSFANLELESYGFQVLFNAEWIFHPSVTSSEKIDSNWTTVTSEDELAKWNMANSTENIILPSILKREDMKVFIHEYEGGLSGFIAHLDAEVVGVSNVFSEEYPSEKLWKDIVQLVSNQLPNFNLVGYERGEDVSNAISCGWESLGPLKVWFHTAHGD